MAIKAIIHCEPRIPWQPKRAHYFAQGFKKVGIPFEITDSRVRLDDGFPVLLGTTCWREIEKTGDYLLVDRCSFGDTERFVSLVWNGHGRRGDHRVPHYAGPHRWERYGAPLQPWRRGHRRVLCGQVETYSPHYSTPQAWYACVRADAFRPHPAGENPTALPTCRSFADSVAVTLNSSIGVQCVLDGIPTVTMDEGAMAWDVTSHDPDHMRWIEREPWCHWLAWTQWTDDEISEGIPWAYHL